VLEVSAKSNNQLLVKGEVNDPELPNYVSFEGLPQHIPYQNGGLHG